jgi:N utilization substance protein A
VTVTERVDEGEQASVLVVVPDNQLSLAIGKRGQNARLAAKLTGMRVDIKSEGELEEERRRDEEERATGREAIGTFAGVGPQMVDRLTEAGLYSPARIVRGGLEALEAVPGLGDKKAEAILQAAADWVAEHPPVTEAELGADEAMVEAAPADQGGVDDGPRAEAG